MNIQILDKSILTPILEEEIFLLFKQLSKNKKQLNLQEILNDSNPIVLAYCLLENKVVGIASMCMYKVISGTKGWIEDVVVDSKFRGKGIGRKLIEFLLNEAKNRGLTEVLLFTEDEKTAAIKLYKSLGFQLKDSKLYHVKT